MSALSVHEAACDGRWHSDQYEGGQLGKSEYDYRCDNGAGAYGQQFLYFSTRSCSRVDSTPVADYAVSYQAARKQVTVLSPAVQAHTSAAGKHVVAADANCTGTYGYTGFYGWGWQWALNSCDTDLVISLPPPERSLPQREGWRKRERVSSESAKQQVTTLKRSI